MANKVSQAAIITSLDGVGIGIQVGVRVGDGDGDEEGDAVGGFGFNLWTVASGCGTWVGVWLVACSRVATEAHSIGISLS